MREIANVVEAKERSNPERERNTEIEANVRPREVELQLSGRRRLPSSHTANRACILDEELRNSIRS